MKNKFLKDKFKKYIWLTIFICIILFVVCFMHWKLSKRYTFDFHVKVDTSQQLTVRLRGKECGDGRYDYGIDKIDILKNNKKIQTIVLADELPEEDRSLLLNGHTQSPRKDGCFEVVDINFDGAEDFSLMAEGYAGANAAHCYFIWNSEKQEYEYAFNLVMSSDLKIENEEITIEVQNGYNPPWEVTYGYDENGILQELVCIEREFWEKKYVKSFVYERIDGEMIFQRSEIEISIDDGEEVLEEECRMVAKWLEDNLDKNADESHVYFYTPYKKISFDDKEFYYVGVRWGEVNEAGEVDMTSKESELIITCDFSEEYSAACKEGNRLIIFDYPEKNHRNPD